MKVKFSDITKYSKGIQIKGDDLIKDGEYFYLNGGINPSGKWNSANVSGDTVTISEGGNSAGYVNYMEKPFWCGAHCYYLFDGPQNTKYLYYALKSQQERLFKIRSGACMPNIKKTDLAKFEFNFDMDEQNQNKVVSVLSRVEDVITRYKKEIEMLDKLIRARFVEMFYDKGYSVLKWNDVFNTTTGKLDSNAAVDGGTYPFFTCSKEVLRIDDYAFEEEALLLAGNNAAGKYDVKYYSGKFNAYQRTYVLTLKENWSYRLFQYQLEDKLKYLQQQSLGGLTKYLTLKILGELEFIIPPKKQQDKFDLFIKQIDKSKAAVQKALDEAQLLFDSLMQKYFG